MPELLSSGLCSDSVADRKMDRSRSRNSDMDMDMDMNMDMDMAMGMNMDMDVDMSMDRDMDMGTMCKYTRKPFIVTCSCLHFIFT